MALSAVIEISKSTESRVTEQEASVAGLQASVGAIEKQNAGH